MKELWKDVSGYRGYYQVSNLGQVKSVKRTIVSSVGYKRIFKGYILKYSISIHGYKQVVLSGETKNTHVIHRLVAEAFIPNPENKRTVNHKKGIKLDNRASELEWATDSENQKHAFKIGIKTGTNKGRYGSDHTRSIPVIQYSLDGKFIAEYGSQTDASLKTGINKQCINSACRGKIKTSGGYIWKVKSFSM